MAESYNLARNVQFPRRTISFPTRSPSSNTLEIVSELKSLRASVSVVPPCPRTVESCLGKLAEMYEVVGEITMSLGGRNGKVTVEGAIDDVLLCWTYVGLPGTWFQAQSTKSRTCSRFCGGIPGGRIEVERQVKSFVRFRKNTRRATSNHLEQLKRLERKNSVVAMRFTNMGDGHPTTALESLRDLYEVTVTMLRSFLVFFCPSPKGRGIRGWSFLSRLVFSTDRGKRRSNPELNAAEGVDSAVFSLTKKHRGHEAGGIEEVRKVQCVLEEMIGNCILGLEEG